MNYYRIGIITKPHGIKGYVKVHSETDFPDRFLTDEFCIIEKDGNYTEHAIQDARVHGGGGFVMKFEGIDSANDAELYRGCNLVVDEAHLHPIDDDEYYLHDLIGCQVVADTGEIIGVMTDIFPTGSNDVYVVENSEGKEVLIPAIKDIVQHIDISEKRIVIHIIEGLLS